MDNSAEYALSIKQPWAALILFGVKSLEIRSWPTSRRGTIYIHAARVTDKRSHGWDLLPAETKEVPQLTGGLIGTVELTECVAYRTREEFVRDCNLHRNDPIWWNDKVLYGFRFANPKIVPFRPLSGWFRFFSVPDKDEPPKPKRSKKTSV